MLQRQAPLPPRWPQGRRRAAGQPGSTNWEPRPPGAPSASPSHPQASASDNPPPAPRPAQSRVWSLSVLTRNAPHGAPSSPQPQRRAQGRPLTRGQAQQGSREPDPALSLFGSPRLQGRHLSGQRAPTAHPGRACSQPHRGEERQGPGPVCSGPSKMRVWTTAQAARSAQTSVH